MFSIFETSFKFCAGAQRRIYPSRELAAFVLSSNAKYLMLQSTMTNTYDLV